MTQHRFSHDNRYCLFFVQNTDTFLFVGVIVNNEDSNMRQEACEVYRPDCTKEAESAMYIDMIKQNIDIPSMFVGQYVYILDEADKLSPNNIAKLKTTIDAIDRRRQKNLPVYVSVIFTSAKKKEHLTDTQQKHWDELCTRCIRCNIGVTAEEMNDYFAFLTSGAIRDISRRITMQSMRAAWDYIDEHDIEITV